MGYCKRRLGQGLACLVLLAGAAQSHGAVLAHFTDGNDNTAPVNPGLGAPTADSFRGAAAGGWQSAWTLGTPFGTATSQTQVTNATPLDSGGNYLQVDFTSGAGPAGHVVRRQYSSNVGSGGIDITQDHTISFQFRLDSPAANRSTTTVGDVIRFFDNIDNSSSSGTATSWSIMSSSATFGGRLAFVAGNGAGAGGITTIDTGIAVVNDAVYTVSVTVHPVAGPFDLANNFPTWDATISDGVTTFTQTGMRFRNNAVTTGRVLQFSGEVNTAGERLAFSIDNVSVVVPEPASAILLGVVAAGTLCRRNRVVS